MNHLAHFHLAWPDEEWVAGGLEGDYLKGPLRGELPPGIEQGVALHRAIDSYTDSHATLAALREQFPPSLRRYAGILIDLGCDHFLSLHWQQFSALPLPAFSRDIYRQLHRQQRHLSPPAQRMSQRMAEYDVLGRYGEWESVAASAARVGERFRRGNPLREVAQPLAALRDPMEQAFLAFYPELQAHVRGLSAGHNCAGTQKSLP